MGLRYPFGYGGYECAFLHTFIELLDMYCTGCHTNDDVNGNCMECPIGKLVYASKDYVMQAYESDMLKAAKEVKLLRKIKRSIKDIRPHPLFNACWIWQDERTPDVLATSRELLADLEFMSNIKLQDFRVRENIIKLYKKQFLKTGGKTNGKPCKAANK
jgi:hypothetical protein